MESESEECLVETREERGKIEVIRNAKRAKLLEQKGGKKAWTKFLKR